jgi:hypothetical protein
LAAFGAARWAIEYRCASGCPDDGSELSHNKDCELSSFLVDGGWPSRSTSPSSVSENFGPVNDFPFSAAAPEGDAFPNGAFGPGTVEYGKRSGDAAEADGTSECTPREMQIPGQIAAARFQRVSRERRGNELP